MSLTGNLEDLPLLDILQIVSFSKKTGYLSIQAEVGHGAIVFEAGFVVAAFTWQTPPLDPRARTLPKETRAALLRGRIEAALEQLIRMREGVFDFSLTEIAPLEVSGRDIEFELLSEGINAQELMLDLARGMDEDRRSSTAAVEASFAAPAEDPAMDVAMDVAMDMDPDMDSDMDSDLDALLEPPPLPGSIAEPPPLPPEHLEPPPLPPRAPALATPVAPEAESFDPTTTMPLRKAAPVAGTTPLTPGRTVLLVDDEEDIRRILGRQFTGAGHAVIEAEDPESAVRKGMELAKAGTAFVLVIDLGMPTSGGTSFHGGFEAVRKLARADVRPPILLMTETLTPPLSTRARELGIRSFVFKPGLSKLDPEQFEADLKAFAAKIVADVLPRLTVHPPEPAAAAANKPAPKHAPKPAPAETPAPAATPAPATAPPTKPNAPRPPAPPRPPAATADELSRELAMLGQRLDELRRPQDPTQIAALVMGVAREFFERSVLFLVKGEELRGVNGFGPTARGESLELLSREIVIPLGEKSIFSDVAKARRGFTGALPVSALTTDLLDSIGKLSGSDVALLPLVTQRETIAILYGDNPTSGRPPGRLDSLRLFINQAGIALENAILHRKVHALTGQE